MDPARELVNLRLERILPTVGKPARYVGGETNAISKDGRSCPLHVAVAFPDVYEVGMSNLAIAILYDVLNSREDTWAERVFAPWPDAELAMRAAGMPLFSLESRTPVRDFDIIGFSIAFELCYTNVLNMLDLAGLPVHASDRDERHPLVIAGGHCALSPEPIAPFIDAFVIGEGEEVVHELLDVCRTHSGQPRRQLLIALAHVSGVYVPALYRAEDELNGTPEPTTPDAPRRVQRRYVRDVDGLAFPTRPIVPLIEVVHDRISVEVMRGCTRGCRFCQAGMITRPVRERSAETVLRLSDELVAGTGHEEISLVSLSTADHSELDAMVGSLISRHGPDGVGVSLPSLRTDRRCVELAERIQTVRKSGLTFAPEAGSQRLRDAINKGVTEEDLEAAAQAAFGAGWRHMKLYFMIGLPTETDDDVVAIAELAQATARIGRRHAGRAASIAVSVSGFIPKPHTPFQWRAQDTPDELLRKQALLRRSLGDRTVSLKAHDPLAGRVEAVLARGGRAVSRSVFVAWRLGARFDAWREHFRYDRWMRAFALTEVDAASVANRVRGYHEPLPWDHIATGVSKAYLRAEDRRADRAQLTPDCHDGACTMCQACERWLRERGRGTQMGER